MTAIDFRISDSNVTSYELIPTTDEADDIAASVLAHERIAQGTDGALTIEESMRLNNIDPQTL